METPLATMLFRLARLERQRHVERVPNSGDRRSYLIRLTAGRERLLGEARAAFRDYAKGVEGRLGSERVAALRAAAPNGLRDAVNAEFHARG